MSSDSLNPSYLKNRLAEGIAAVGQGYGAFILRFRPFLIILLLSATPWKFIDFFVIY
jgi:hypothetical protein